MLSFLHISNLGVIGDATLEPSPGLTVVTGETGAGKTLVVTGLGLLLGQRGDVGLVRHGSDKALVEGGFTGLTAVTPWLDEMGVRLDDDGNGPELLVARQISAQGRARTFLGGLQVPLAALADMVGELAAIHGQSEQVRLATPERQREMLDRAAGPALAAILVNYRREFARRRDAAAQRADLVARAQARAREADMLRYGLDEIAAVSPQPGEDVTLAAEAHRLQDIDDIRMMAAQADAALSGGSSEDGDALGAVGLVGQARKALGSLAHRDGDATGLVARATEALDGVANLAAEVASYLASLEADPVRLETVAARRADLQALTRKYGSTIDEVLAWAQGAADQLSNLNNDDQRIEQLAQEIAELDESLAAQAAQMTELRARASQILAEAVQRELAALAMPHAQLGFRLEPLEQLGQWGAESVQLLFTANAGLPPAPLAKVASGGELSRLRLALEVVLATHLGYEGPAPSLTYVFDEVDSGVGGAVGIEIGRRLSRLATTDQVIVVTHLAQVAVWADRHFVVAKGDDRDMTTAELREVTGDQRVAEIARMMGGLSGSQAGLEHARDLLAAARTGSP